MLQRRYSHHRPWRLWSGLWMGFNSPSQWWSFDSHRDTLTPAKWGRGLNNQRLGDVRPQFDVLCLQNKHMSEFVFLSCISLAGLCSPLEKRILRLRAHPSTWILLHHSSNASGQDKTTHSLLWRYSKGTMMEKHRRNFFTHKLPTSHIRQTSSLTKIIYIAGGWNVAPNPFGS